MIKHYMKGIKYNMVVDPYDESLGIVEMKIGHVKYNIFFIKTIYCRLNLFNYIFYSFSLLMNQII